MVYNKDNERRTGNGKSCHILKGVLIMTYAKNSTITAIHRPITNGMYNDTYTVIYSNGIRRNYTIKGAMNKKHFEFIQSATVESRYSKHTGKHTVDIFTAPAETKEEPTTEEQAADQEPETIKPFDELTEEEFDAIIAEEVEKEYFGEPAADQGPEEIATLKNYDEVRETLIETIADLEARKNRYQTDIYLYIDENGHGTIDTFVNVGGNSWLNDDHIKIYTDREHCETKLDDLQNGDGRGAWNWLIDELENTYNLTGIKEKIYNSCCDDDDDESSFKSFDDLEPYDIESTLYALYCDEIDSYYRDYFIPDCCMDYISEYADQALEDYR